MKKPSLSISQFLGFGFGTVLVLLIAVAGLGQYSASVIQHRIHEITGINAKKSKLANEMIATMNEAGIHSRSSVMLDGVDPARSKEEAKKVGITLKRYSTQEAQLYSLLQENKSKEEEMKFYKSITEISKKTMPELLGAVEQAMDGDIVGANMTLMVRVNPGETKWAQQLAGFLELQNAINQEAVQQAEKIQTRSVSLGLTLVAAALAIGSIIAWRITRSITGSIGSAVQVTERIAAGDLTTQIETSNSSHEMARLLSAVSVMQNKLHALVSDIGQTANNIQMASSEVAAATMDLSHRTETASQNLESSSNKLRELNSGVKNNVEAARQADQLASVASTKGENSTQVVNQVVSTMDEISASSKKIASIISVIDGIAFQTNLLALNAAVEAARAGDQGRGFGVVAAEVRNLAGKVAASAKEINALIKDSVSRVDTGSVLAGQAGRSIHDLLRSITDVATIIRTMSSSAEDQQHNLATLAEALDMLDGMVQQNTAMVEQSAAAAESLKDQAQQLTQHVCAFHLR